MTVCEATLRPVGTHARGALCLGFFFLWKFPDLLLLGREDFSRCLCCFLGFRHESLSLVGQQLLTLAALSLRVGSVRILLLFNAVFSTVRFRLCYMAYMSILDSWHLLRKLTQNLSPHPNYIFGYSNIGGILPFPSAQIPALPPSRGAFLASSLWRNSHELLNHQPVFDQLRSAGWSWAWRFQCFHWGPARPLCHTGGH